VISVEPTPLKVAEYGQPQVKDHLEDLGVDGRIIWILNK
jgi:hypothetical protein